MTIGSGTFDLSVLVNRPVIPLESVPEKGYSLVAMLIAANLLDVLKLPDVIS